MRGKDSWQRAMARSSLAFSVTSPHAGRKTAKTNRGFAFRGAEPHFSEIKPQHDRRRHGVDQFRKGNARSARSADIPEPLPGKGPNRGPEEDPGPLVGNKKRTGRKSGQAIEKNAGTGILPRRYTGARIQNGGTVQEIKK